MKRLSLIIWAVYLLTHAINAQDEKEKQDELLCSLILEYHATYDGILGYRRMTLFINRLNQTSYSEGYIHRLMSYLGITARICLWQSRNAINGNQKYN